MNFKCKAKRRVLVLLGFMIVLLISSIYSVQTAYAQAAQTQQTEEIDFTTEIDRQINELDTPKWDQELNHLPDEVKEIFKDKSFAAIIQEYASGVGSVDEGVLFTSFFNVAKKELAIQLRLVTALLALAVIGGITTQLKSSFGNGTGDAAGFVCYIMSVLIAVYAFAETVSQARVAIDSAGRIMEIAFPPMLALLAASGSVASAGVFQPATALLSSATSVVLSKIALPLTLALGVMAVVGNLSKRMPLSRMQALLKTTLKWMLGAMSTLFIGFGAIRGIMAKGMDGVSLRAARFALDKFIPYVGGLLSGSVDTVLGCSTLIKNAVGLCSVLLMAAALAVPLIHIAAAQLSMRIAAALIEPVGDPQLTKALSDIADVLGYLFAIVAVAGLMFALLTALVMSAGGIYA